MKVSPTVLYEMYRKQNPDHEFFHFLAAVFDVTKAAELAKEHSIEPEEVGRKVCLHFSGFIGTDSDHVSDRTDPLIGVIVDGGLLIIDGYHRMAQWRKDESRETFPVLVLDEKLAKEVRIV